MFYFIKRLAALHIVTEPCANGFLLFGSFPVFLHYALDVGSFVPKWIIASTDIHILLSFKNPIFYRHNVTIQHNPLIITILDGDINTNRTITIVTRLGLGDSGDKAKYAIITA